jgi:HEXXH motif-containing protein
VNECTVRDEAHRSSVETASAVRHGIAGSAFDALASGDGCVHTVETLTRAQLSKRLLLLWNLVGLVDARWPGSRAAACVHAAFDTLAAARRDRPDRVDEILTYPTVGAWLLYCQRRLDGVLPWSGPAEYDLGHAAAVAAAAAAHAGYPFDLPVPVRDGCVALPGLGVARAGAGNGWGCARSAGAGHVTLETSGHRLKLRLDAQARQPTGSWLPVRRLDATASRHRLMLAVDDVDPYRNCDVLAVAPRIDTSTLRTWADMLEAGWSMLAGHDPGRAAATAAGLSALVPLDGSADLAVTSATSSDALGAVALTPPAGPTDLALTLVHEFQHFKLDALLDLVPLHDDSPEAVHFAPWRSDPRPINGLLHGAYAFLGVAAFWFARQHTLTGQRATAVGFEFAWCREAVGRALSGVRESGHLTALGERFTAGMAARLAQWRATAVPPVAARWARAMNDDAHVLWRLRNLHPDPAHVAEWADAWTRRRPCPRPEAPRTEVRAGTRFPDRHRRFHLVQVHLGDSARFGRMLDEARAEPGRREGCGYRSSYDVRIEDVGTDDVGTDDVEVTDGLDADVLLVGGDIDEAAVRYAELVAVRPQDTSPFAGLALIRRHAPTPGARVYAECPEALHALVNRIRRETGRTPDVDRLADWVATGPTR